MQNTYQGIRESKEKMRPIIPKLAGIVINIADIKAQIAVDLEKTRLRNIVNEIKNNVISPRK